MKVLKRLLIDYAIMTNVFVFKSDGGVKQLQLKKNDLYLKDEMLSKVYES